LSTDTTYESGSTIRIFNGVKYLYSTEGFLEVKDGKETFWSACDYAKTRKGFVKTVDTWFWVEEEGEGDPLILIHGGPGVDHRYFHPSFSVLAYAQKLIYYDLRGHGMSSESLPARQHGVLDDADDLELLRLAMGLEQINLFGHSYGGLVVLAYANKYPQSVKKIILCSTPLGETDEEIDKRVESASITKLMEEAESEEEYDKLYYKFYYHKPPSEDVIRYNKLSMESYNTEKNKELLKSYENDKTSFDFKNILTALELPVLVVAGKHDLIVNVEAIEEVVSDSRNVKFRVYEESGHDPFVDEQERFTKDVNRFLLRSI
jgi:proline iminopeptidase